LENKDLVSIEGLLYQFQHHRRTRIINVIVKPACRSMLDFTEKVSRSSRSLNKPRLTGCEVVIVTGCASGIGLATTQLLLSLGAKVFGLDVCPTTLDHPSFSFHMCDVSSSEAASRAVQLCVEQYGHHVDVLANVAGVMDGFASADTVCQSEWHRMLNINLTACMYLSQAVLPFMLPSKSGAIINVASRAALGGGAAGVAYTASKHGLVCCSTILVPHLFSHP